MRRSEVFRQFAELVDDQVRHSICQDLRWCREQTREHETRMRMKAYLDLENRDFDQKYEKVQTLLLVTETITEYFN